MKCAISKDNPVAAIELHPTLLYWHTHQQHLGKILELTAYFLPNTFIAV